MSRRVPAVEITSSPTCRYDDIHYGHGSRRIGLGRPNYVQQLEHLPINHRWAVGGNSGLLIVSRT